MDRLTLFSMQGGLMVFMGVMVILAWRAQRRQYSDNGPLWFSLGFVIGGVGLMLQAYRGIIPSFFSIIMGNFLFLMLYVFIERAVAITTRRTSRMYWILSVICALILSYVYFTYIRPDIIIRTIEAVIVMPLVQIPIWVHLFRCRENVIRPALKAMAVVLFVHILMNFVRAIGVLLLHKADAWFTWTGVITIAGLALSFMWIDSLRLRDELERRAMTDPLTGLLNRRALDDFGLRELSRATRLGLPCSALAIDVNSFKEINDTYGHAAGDSALCAVASALRSSLRISDLATRIGGDEFFVLLPGSNEHVAKEVSSRLRNAIQSLRLETVHGATFSITVSIGCVTARGENMTIADLFHDSDVNLYQEKQSKPSRNSSVIRSHQPAHPPREHSEIIGIQSSNA